MRTTVTTTTTAIGFLAVLAACGGGDKRPAAPIETAADDGGAGPATSDILIPDEKYEEIKSVFERKTAMVSRCYVAGIESDEVEKATKGFVTVGLTVTTDGKASDVRILKSSFGSAAVDGCVVDMVRGWDFTDALPKPLETSHTYVLDRF